MRDETDGDRASGKSRDEKPGLPLVCGSLPAAPLNRSPSVRPPLAPSSDGLAGDKDASFDGPEGR